MHINKGHRGKCPEKRGREEEEGEEEEEDLLNVISSDTVGIGACHHGLHLHQVLLHLSFISLVTHTKTLVSFLTQKTHTFLTPKSPQQVDLTES